MCTVSIVPHGDALRLVCNRDERRTRPDAHAPVTLPIGGRAATFPIDPRGGGTWIGVNDRGIALALLNRTPTRVIPEAPRTSRGLIIPPLLACSTLEELLERTTKIAAAHFAPFRLIALRGADLAVIGSDGRAVSWTRARVETPLVFTSSSLGDHFVEVPRRELFRRIVLESAPARWRDAQRRFHQHRWRARPEISVLMSRVDARTVSRTIVELAPGVVALRYQPLPQVH